MVPRVCAAGVHPILEWHRTCPCCVQVFHHLLPSQVVSHCCHHIARCSYPLLPGNSFSTSFILTRPLFSCPCLHLENPSSFLTLPGLAGRLPSRGCRLCPFPLSLNTSITVLSIVKCVCLPQTQFVIICSEPGSVKEEEIQVLNHTRTCRAEASGRCKGSASLAISLLCNPQQRSLTSEADVCGPAPPPASLSVTVGEAAASLVTPG